MPKKNRIRAAESRVTSLEAYRSKSVPARGQMRIFLRLSLAGNSKIW